MRVDAFDNMNSTAYVSDSFPPDLSEIPIEQLLNSLADSFPQDLSDIPIDQLFQVGGALPETADAHEQQVLVGGAITQTAVKRKQNKKFGIYATQYTYRINNNQETNFFMANDLFKNFIREFSDQHVNHLHPQQKIRCYINHPGFDTAINMPFMFKHDYSYEIISKQFYNVAQSRKTRCKLNFFS